MKLIDFLLILWVSLALLEPDPDLDSGTLLKMDPDPNPYPQHWDKVLSVLPSTCCNNFYCPDSIM